MSNIAEWKKARDRVQYILVVETRGIFAEVNSQNYRSSTSNLHSPWVIALAITSGVMLLATMFYPFGYDQAVFSVGGEMILKQHAIPYRDFLDTKPPMIFYLYAAALWLFGHHEWSIRVFDILFQAGSAYYFYRILRRFFDARFALAAVSISVIIYAGSGFWHTAQAESFALLPSLVLLDVTSRVDSKTRSVFLLGCGAAVAAMVLFLLKFTLVLGAAAAVVYVLVRRDLKFRVALMFIAAMASSFLVLAIAIGCGLHSAGALAPFLEAMRWTMQYASITSAATGTSLAEQLFVLFPERFIYCTSATVFVLGVLGLWLCLKRCRAGEGNPMLGLLALTLLFQLAGIVLERKIVFDYQYARAVWAFVPFAVLGGWGLMGHLGRRGFPRWGVGVLVIIAVAGSPLVRIYTQSIAWGLIAVRHQDAGVEVHKRIGDYFADEQQAVGEYLRSHMADTDKLFFWGNDVAVYWYAKKLPPTICLTATPLRTSFTPQVWRGRMMKQLIAAKPKYFVTEFGDAKEYITGSATDSYEAMMQWPVLASYSKENYVRDAVIGHYIISHVVRTDR